MYVILDSSKNRDNSTKVTTNPKPTTEVKSPVIPPTTQKDTNSTDTSKASDTKNSDTTKASDASQATQNTNETYTLYKVKKGDTLSSISKSYESMCPVSILSKAILKANNFSKESDLKEAMEIKIPDKYINGATYTVKTGDSLYSIALSSYGNTKVYEAIEILKADNYLTTGNIKVGDKLFISNVANTSNSSSEASSNTKTEENESTTTNTAPVSDTDLVSYTFKTGDTLTKISKQYEKYCPLTLSSKVILKANGLTDAKEIKVGTEIKIPEKYLTNGEKYTVKAGDTLSTIAQKYMKDMKLNSAIEKIKSDNFISSTNIKAGDVLYLINLPLTASN
jgi:LysM repeat protein